MTLENKIDCLFLVTKSSGKTYQKLSFTYSAIEPPTWALLLAQSTRDVGFKVNILDANAEDLSEQKILERIKNLDPKLICLVVYGQNVNAGTVNMSGAVYISNYLKEINITTPIACLGSYIQSVPVKTLNEEPSIDFGFTNEGVYALRNVLAEQEIDINNLGHIKGLVWRENGLQKLTHLKK